MPTYDYECPEGHRFEIFQKMSDAPVTECPECGAPAKRLISGGAGFLFKGEGFYITDYRSEEYKKKASAEPGASTAPGSGEGGASRSDAKGSESGSGGSSASTDGSGAKGASGSGGSSSGSGGEGSSGSGGSSGESSTGSGS